MSTWRGRRGYRIDESHVAFEYYGRDFFMDERTGAFTCDLCLPLRHG